MNKTEIIRPKFLVISYDENIKKSTSQDEYFKSISAKIEELKPDLVVCCTQNSLACSEDHFQHYFKEFITKELRKEKALKYSLILKADATTENDSSFLSCVTKISNNSKPYNVRTRVYGNDDTLDADVSGKNISTKSVSGKFNKKSKYDVWYSIRSKKPPTNKFYVQKIGFRRITETSQGIGGIMLDIMICRKPDDDKTIPTCFQNIFCNYNLGESSSTRILNGMATSNMFYTEENILRRTKNNKNKSTKLKHELQIFMITPDSVTTRQFSIGKNQNILVPILLNNKSEEPIINREKRITGKNFTGIINFKRINNKKINNIVSPEKVNIEGLKELKMFSNNSNRNTVVVQKKILNLSNRG